MDSFTTDTFFNGRLLVDQPRSGYRYSIDAVILSYLASCQTCHTVLDLGTGCGIIPMILAFRNPDLQITAIEIQDELANIASRNVTRNRMEDRIKVHCMDMKQMDMAITSRPVDMVVCNPPYRKMNSGRINPNRQRAVARHEIMATLEDVIQAAKRFLKTAGVFMIIYPAQRLADLFLFMRKNSIEPKRLVNVHSTTDSEAELVVVKGTKGGRPGLKIDAPVYIYEKEKIYTQRVQDMFNP